MAGHDREQGGAACPIFPKKGPRAVVLCDGPPPDGSLLTYWLRGADLFVCADAAGHPYDHLPRVPDVVIGDFDSLAGRLLDTRGGPRFLQVEAQNSTDSEKAIRYCEEVGMAEAVLLGATGWRLDHTLYNCTMLERFAGRLRLCVAAYDADAVRLDASGPISWRLPLGTRFSLLPLMGDARGVTLEGARFPLLNETVGPGAGPATISNEVDRSPLLISLKSGSLLVTVERTGPEDLAEFEE